MCAPLSQPHPDTRTFSLAAFDGRVCCLEAECPVHLHRGPERRGLWLRGVSGMRGVQWGWLRGVQWGWQVPGNIRTQRLPLDPLGPPVSLNQV